MTRHKETRRGVQLAPAYAAGGHGRSPDRSRLRQLDLNLLRVLYAVLRTRSATRAGEELALSQSAVSNGLGRLRRVFDDPLFVPGPQGLVPTALAEKLAGSLRETLDRLERTVSEASHFDPADSSRAFRLYMSDVGQMVFLPSLVAHLAAAAPGVSLATVAPQPQEAAALMRAGEIDLAIGFFLAFEAGFRRQRLFTEHYVCMVRAGHPRIGERLTLAQYLAAEHAVYRPAAGSHAAFEQAVDKVFLQAKARRRVTLRLAHSLGLSRVIAGSDLVIAVPSRLAAAYAGFAEIRVLPLPFPSPRFEITQQWHERVHADPAHRWLRATFKRLFAD